MSWITPVSSADISAQTLLYTVTAGYEGRLTIDFTNRSTTTPATVKLWVVPSAESVGDAHVKEFSTTLSIAGTRQAILSRFVSVPGGGKVYVQASNANVSCQLTGDVISPDNTESALTTAITAATTFTQSGTGAVPRTMQSKERDIVSVLDFGATGDGSTDDISAINLAVAAAVAAGKSLRFPAGTYKISTEISITAPLLLIGDGAKVTVIRQTGAAANGLNFNFAALIQGGGVIGISVEAGAGWITAGNQGSGSTGIGIKVTNSNGKFYVQDYGIHNFDTACSVLGSYYTSWSNGEHLYCTTDAINLNRSGAVTGAGNWFTNIKLSNFGFSGTNTASKGLNMIASAGDFFSGIDATSFNNGVVIQPTASTNCLYGFFDRVLTDTSASDNWLIDGTSNLVYSMCMTNCWGAFSTNGAGLVTKGANLDSVRWVGGRLRENGKEGWSHQGGVNVEVIGSEIAANSKLTSNTYDGVLVAANVSSWAVQNCRVGNFASSLSGQANGVNIAAGASQNFRITGNNLNNPGSGKSGVVNGTSSLNFVVSNNLPRQSAGVNTSDRQSLTGGTFNNVAAASTVYLGASGQQAGVLAAPYLPGLNGVCTGFYVGVAAAPGAAQTFTYKVYLDGVATSMTGSISGAGSFSVAVSTNAFTFTENQAISLELITSAGATATTHRWNIKIEP